MKIWHPTTDVGRPHFGTESRDSLGIIEAVEMESRPSDIGNITLACRVNHLSLEPQDIRQIGVDERQATHLEKVSSTDWKSFENAETNRHIPKGSRLFQI